MVQAVLALIAWTLVMWLWMYARRFPAIQRTGQGPQAFQHKEALNALPNDARRVADNYNHLHEQPTLFYALCLTLLAAGLADATAVALAWAYVASRVAHSLVQATVNLVAARFALFTLGTLILGAMTVRALLAAF